MFINSLSLYQLRTGVIMNILSVLIVVLGVSTWTLSILGIGDNVFDPSWKASNVTTFSDQIFPGPV